MKTVPRLSGEPRREWFVPGLALAILLGGVWMVSRMREDRSATDQVEPPDDAVEEIGAAPQNEALEQGPDFRSDRMDQIRDLLQLLERAPDSEKPPLLDTLASLQSIEATAALIGMLRETTDAEMSARILNTLRACTLITSSDIRTDIGERGLIRDLEAIQDVFRRELARPERDATRLRAAVAAIADVFPGEEAEHWFAYLEAARQSSPGNMPIEESELLGRWLEFMTGDVERRDFDRIAAFIREHPSSVADERGKARVVNCLDITPIRPEEIGAVSDVLELLVPASAPDDSYVRWLRVRERVTGAREPLARLLASGDAMRQSALVLFGGHDLPRELGEQRLAKLKRDLGSAARMADDEEAGDFIRGAADSISLGESQTGGYAPPR